MLLFLMLLSSIIVENILFSWPCEEKMLASDYLFWAENMLAIDCLPRLWDLLNKHSCEYFWSCNYISGCLVCCSSIIYVIALSIFLVTLPCAFLDSSLCFSNFGIFTLDSISFDLISLTNSDNFLTFNLVNLGNFTLILVG